MKTPEQKAREIVDQTFGEIKKERFTPCYCGGQIREIWTRDKRTPYGWVRNHCKQPRWVLDNCVRRAPAREEDGQNGL